MSEKQATGIDITKLYFKEVVEMVDTQYTKGYSEKNPDLIKFLIQKSIDNEYLQNQLQGLLD